MKKSGKLACILFAVSALLCHAVPTSDSLDYANSPPPTFMESSTSTTIPPTSGPSRPAVRALYILAKKSLPGELTAAGVNAKTTMVDLDQKLSPLLDSKYDNDRHVVRFAFECLADIGIPERTLDDYRYQRTMDMNAKAHARRVQGGFKRFTPYRPRTGVLPMLKMEGPLSKTAQLRRIRRDSDMKELLQRIQKAGFQDETDQNFFLQHQDELKGKLGVLRYGQLLGEHMIKKTKDKDWYQKLVKARDNAKVKRCKERKRAQNGQTLPLPAKEKMRNTHRREGRLKGATDVDLESVQEPLKLRPRRRPVKYTVSSEDDDEFLPVSNPKTAEDASEVSLPSRGELATTKKWPTRARSTLRRPRIMDSTFPFASLGQSLQEQRQQRHLDSEYESQNSEEWRPSSTVDSGSLAEYRGSASPSDERGYSRPTTGVKRFRGALPTTADFQRHSSEESVFDAARPTVAKKRFTGSKPILPQTAGLAPKKASQHQAVL